MRHGAMDRVLLVGVLALQLSVGGGRAVEVSGGVGVGGGFRYDDFDWNEGETGIWRSELTWDDVLIAEMSVEGGLLLDVDEGSGPCIGGTYRYGSIQDGETTDTDWLGGVRFNRSEGDVEGDVSDAAVDVGYLFVLTEPGAELPSSMKARLGYAYSEQNFDEENLRNTFPITYSVSGPISSYDAEWSGPYVGMHFRAHVTEAIALTGTLELHIAEYEGVADWTLRDDFAHPVSFRHSADGYGIVAGVGATWRLVDVLSLGLGLDYQNWRCEDGNSRTYFADGTETENPLHEVNWTRLSVAAKVSGAF